MKATEKNREYRFNNCEEFKNALFHNSKIELLNLGNTTKPIEPISSKTKQLTDIILPKKSYKKLYAISGLFLVIAAIIILLISGKSKYHYFKKINFNKYPIEGKFPVDEKEIIQSKCYHFEYDNNGRIEYLEYLVLGNQNNNSIFGDNVSKVQFEYGDNYETRKYLNLFGANVKNDKKVSINKYQFDKLSNSLWVFNNNINNILIIDEQKVFKTKFLLN
ncbi:MAG TPA: hypothetical protein VIK14_12260, partial [Ignavibacteria bacterium]